MRIPIIRFGFVPMGEHDELRAALRQLCDDLGYFLGTTCQPAFAPSYDQLLAMVSQSRVDVAWLPPMLTLKARKEGWAAPFMAMVRSGETSYYSALFVRKDAAYHTISDLKGVRVAWVSPGSASGYLVPRSTLHALGVRMRQAFSEELFAGSHEEVVRFVWEKKADVGAGFVHAKDQSKHEVLSASWTESDIGGSFRILSMSGPIPTDALVLHRGLYDELAPQLREAFAWIKGRESASSFLRLFASEGVEPCEPAFVDGLDRLVRLGDVPQRPKPF